MDTNQLTKEELDRYQQMTQEVLNYIMQNQDNEIAQHILEIIRNWCC
jgi:hypothetical protein